jgi:hypothetical protein
MDEPSVNRARRQPYAESKFTDILAPVEACLPKDEAGNFNASQERSDVVHDSPGFPGGKDTGDEQEEVPIPDPPKRHGISL